jgi:hypothetical protein
MKKKVLSRKRAIDLLHHVGARLMLMHSNTDGMRWFILHEDGGELAESDALKIIERPDIRPMHDGLFPNVHQSFVMVR